MKLPFELPLNHLPVVVPRPKVRPQKLADDSVIYEAHIIRYLDLKSDRGLYEIGFMLDLLQFGNLRRDERFTLQSLERRLRFSDKLVFPELRDTGRLHDVEASNNKYVWATIPNTVVVTSPFTVLDIHDQRMALEEPEVLREAIELNVQGCPLADIDEILERFRSSKSPHLTDISSALKSLEHLGIIRDSTKTETS